MPELPQLTRRQWAKAMSALGAGAMLSGCQHPATRSNGTGTRKAAAGQGPVVSENEHPGTLDWLLTKTGIDPATKFRCPWIEGYCSQTSVRAGETLDIFVSCNPASEFSIDVYRMGYYGGLGARHMLRLGPFDGRPQPDPEVGSRRLRDCRWERSASLAIPADWVSGVYLGKLTAQREGWQSYVIFVVRDDRWADLMFQCSDTTWQAYNRWPSQFSLYDNGEHQWWCGPGVEVSFNRPYGKYCQILDAPLSTGSGEWFLWEFPFAYWLERHGYDVTYVSNLDTHSDPAGLRRVRGFLSVGHDEYYSLQMYEQLRGAITEGLNVGFFSGNTCCGRIEFLPGSGNRIFTRADYFGPRDEGMLERFVGMKLFPYQSPHERLLLGARNVPPCTGGSDWVVTAPDHWLYQGTHMSQGDAIPGLIGWEFHGDPAPLPGLEVVASAPTQSAPGRPNGGTYTATIYPGPKGNFVFNASTCWWADGLSAPPGYVRPSVYTSPQGPDARVQRMTANILGRMLAVVSLIGTLLLAAGASALAEESVLNSIDERFDEHRQIALKIWDLAELGYQEQESSVLLQRTLQRAGFEVTAGVAGMPTAFLATAGSGRPIVAFLAEFDALPGITQTATPARQEISGKAGGHACGHHLFGTASVGAGVAVKEWLAANRIAGTVRVYGTPAEEGGSGKVYMVRAGLFDDVDAVLCWHPDDENRAISAPTLANRSAKFQFRGVSAHAASAPEKARSALDGVEAFNYMVNLLREHVPQETRLHYVITEGGKAPNVVPDFAEVFYYVRHPDARTLADIWERVEAAAQGAATGTGTTVKREIIHGNHSVLPNDYLAGLLQDSLTKVGGVRYDEREQAFAAELYATLTRPELSMGTQEQVREIDRDLRMGSTDVGDVSWTVPTAQFVAATWVPGTAGHSWQAIAAGGTSIGIKGLQVAAKTLALTAVEIYRTPAHVERAKAEFLERRGPDFVYECLLGDRPPPLDYRK